MINSILLKKRFFMDFKKYKKQFKQNGQNKFNYSYIFFYGWVKENKKVKDILDKVIKKSNGLFQDELIIYSRVGFNLSKETKELYFSSLEYYIDEKIEELILDRIEEKYPCIRITTLLKKEKIGRRIDIKENCFGKEKERQLLVDKLYSYLADKNDYSFFDEFLNDYYIFVDAENLYKKRVSLFYSDLELFREKDIKDILNLQDNLQPLRVVDKKIEEFVKSLESFKTLF
jgi:hypothetical protein